MKLPEKVRVGETLSARWLNQVVDCLKELAKASNVGSGSSTSSIEYSGSDYRDTKYRGTGGTDLQELRVSPFQLRLKPKHLCNVSDDGHWEKIAQMKVGAIVDYMGKTHPVPAGQTLFDYADGWVDIGAFTEALQKTYCVITQNEKGEITKVEIKNEEESFVPWGKSELNTKGEGKLSVFIGSYQLKRVEEVNRAHIYQAHCGTLDLQTVQVAEQEEDTEDGASAETDDGYIEPGSGQYESKPAGLFRKRDEHLFIFKNLICCEGLRLTDGKNIRIKLRRANSLWPDDSGAQESLQAGEPILTIGGVEDIFFDSEMTIPAIDSGIIKIPLADTRKEVTGAISGLVVSYVPAVLEDDGSVTFLGEAGSRLPRGAAARAQEGSGSGDGPYINEIVEGVIYLAIPMFADVPSVSASWSMSASESAAESDSASASASGSMSESADASASGSASMEASDSGGTASGSLAESGSAAASGSVPGSEEVSVAGSDSGSVAGSSSTDTSASIEGSTPPGSSPTEGDSSSGSNGGSGGGSDTPPVCDCADQLKALEARVANLEARVAALEAVQDSGSAASGESSPGICNCPCADLLAQIQAAVASEAQTIANSIHYEVSVNGAVVTTTEYGTLVADTAGTVTANGASAGSIIHY